MPYTMKVEGMEDLTAMLQTVEDEAQDIAALALYDGAGVVADAINRGARGIKTAPFKYAKEGSTRLPSPEEKAILTGEGAAGIAKFDKTGNFVGTSIGYGNADYAPVNWNHMKSSHRRNYKIQGMKVVSAHRTHLVKGADGHFEYDKTANRGLTNLKPVAVIANAINSGTSFMQKQPFIRKAANSSKAKANEAIESRIAELVDNALHKGA